MRDPLAPVAEVGGGRRQVHLLGFMGCGKSTVGRALARRLVWNYLDLDALVERHAGRSVADMFRRDGEAGFRQAECHVLRQAVQKPRTVLALGGGTFVGPVNTELSRRVALTCWLDCSFDVCWERMATDDGTARPLATTREAAARLYRERLSAYRKAHYRVDAAAQPELVVDRITELIREDRPADAQ